MRDISHCFPAAALGLCMAASLLGAAMLAAAAQAEPAPAYVTLPDGDVVRITVPEGAPRGLVLLLPDALGGDPRSTPYVEQLLATSFGAVEPQWQRTPPADQPALGRRVADQMRAMAERFGAPPEAIGLVSFGFGGRIALRAALLHGWPAALLYPGCAGLRADPPEVALAGEQGLRVAMQGRAGAPPLLLLEGSADAAEPDGACAAAAARLGPLAKPHVYYGATYGWDYAPGPWENAVSLLPAPEGGGPLRRAHMSSGVTTDAAARIAAFLAAHILASPGLSP